jgi:peptidoglycan-associated lipoprotein
MRKSHTTKWALSAAVALALVAGCGKKPQPTTPQAPPPPPPAPTASLSANPTTIERGQSTRLTWSTQNATEVNIDGIGKVDANGSQDVKPDQSTNYRLIAKGPGGTQESTARVTVSEPAPVQSAQPTLTDEEWFQQSIKDVFFDYDSAAIRSDAQSTIAANAQALNSKQNLKFTIEGHCDERGSTEYNLTLGDERANAVKDALVKAGVNASRINVISYGKEKPACTESTEACWQQNRRGHFVLSR